MPMTIRGQVGPQVLNDGVEQAFRQGKTGELVVTELHGKYFEASYRGSLFVATMTGSSVALTTAATAMAYTLANPAGSGKNVSLIRLEFVIDTAPGTQVLGYYGLYLNTNVIATAVTGTAMTTFPGLIGTNASPVAKAFSTSTVPATPTYYRPLEQKYGALATGQVPDFVIDFDGTCILTPGTAISIGQNVADTTSNAKGVPTFIWEELTL